MVMLSPVSLAFGMMTRFILNMDLRKEARKRIAAMVDEDAEVARNAIHEYYGDLRRMGDFREMNDWAGSLIEKDLPEEMKRTAPSPSRACTPPT